MSTHEFTEITSIRARHGSGMVLELFFNKLKLTKENRFCVVPIESYSVGEDEATGTKKWASDVFLSAMGPWNVGDKIVPMTDEEAVELKSIVKDVLKFWKLPHEIK